MDEQETYVDILNIPILKVTMNQFIENYLTEDLLQNNCRQIVTANPEIIMHAQENQSYLETIKKADYIVADGIGVIYGSKIYKTPLPERIPGFDVMGELLRVANEHGNSIYLFGAQEGVAEKAAKGIKDTYSNTNIVGTHHGFVELDDEHVAKDIQLKQPDIIFVALGYPKQEEWINKYIKDFDKGIFIGVGGSIDVWAGITKRAPAIWQKLNLEWLYRFIHNPSRIGRFIKLPQFLIRVLRDAKKRRKQDLKI